MNPSPSPTRVSAGTLAQSVGDSFEKWIDAQHEMARLLRILARADHNQATAEVVGRKLKYTARGPADYTLLLAGGVYGAAECKSTSLYSKTVESCYLPKAEVAELQRLHLDTTVAANGVAVLLVEFRGGPEAADAKHPMSQGHAPRRYAIPWSLLPWKVLRSAESVCEVDIPARYRIEPGTCYLALFVQDRLAAVAPPSRTERSKKRVYPRE